MLSRSRQCERTGENHCMNIRADNSCQCKLGLRIIRMISSGAGSSTNRLYFLYKEALKVDGTVCHCCCWRTTGTATDDVLP